MSRSAHHCPFRGLHHWVFPIAAGIALAACGGGGSTSEPGPPQASFAALGFLPGYVGSQATAVSSDGRVVSGNAGATARGTQAFLWTAEGGLVPLGFMTGGTYSSADAINADGTVVLAHGDATTQPPTYSGLFLWRIGTAPARLEMPTGALACSGAGISGDAVVVAGTCVGTSANMAYRWTGSAAPVGLGRFGGGTSAASNSTAVSKDGGTIVGFGHPFLTGAIAWDTTGNPTFLGKLPGDSTSYGTAVNRNGSAVVGNSMDDNQISRGFRWTKAVGMESLGPAPIGVVGTYVSGISGDGRRMVGWGTTASEDTALVWDALHGWRPLAAALLQDYRTDVPARALNRATAISDDGFTIVGYGTNQAGQTEAWRIRLPD